MWPWVATLDSSEAIGTLTRIVSVKSPPLAVTALGPWDIGCVFVYLSFEFAQRVETRFNSHGSESCVVHIDRVVNYRG